MGKPQRKRKRRTHVPDENVHGPLDPSKKRPPRALVLRTGKHVKVVKKLERDLKMAMRPNTADKLKQRKGNVMKDFLSVAGPLGISHFLVLSATDKCQYLKLAKSPQGPTATFRIEKWSSSSDFAAAMKNYTAPVGSFRDPPLLVLSGFKNTDQHLKLCATLFQSMFPTMEVQKLKINSNCKRVVLIQYLSDTILFRHYSISQEYVGISKNIKNLLKREIPELGHLQDISQYMENDDEGLDLSKLANEEEEVEEESTPKQKQKSVKLREIGPRLDLRLVKIEEGVVQGKVLYHAFVKK
mmetsp:Transcript_14859/g.28745  ORF Transcript_14859/g.28745 Transcript_14859/m.28745 type:complete len:298 (-) Transcript_14859:39-932(-)